ncbi:P-loop containing nucleoside triphosphate hydrolase protein [Apiospora marii]|uniref:P-loop containing nucleoside triphosphate hydrolase protein n=1 Tax=Apiospora marii TaxID=335849 RepID=UPI003130FD73
MGRISDSSSDFGFTLVFVLGPPGCGKGTLCQRVVAGSRPQSDAAVHPYTHLSLGDHLRELSQQDPWLQEEGSIDYDKICEHIEENKLLPADVLVPVFEHKLGERFATTWLVDGFPRNMETARAFEKALGKPVKVVILGCERATAEARFLQGGRDSADDKERFARRYDEYIENMKAIREHYRDIAETICTDSSLENYLGKFEEVLSSIPDSD